jgi:hypothetical protein
MHYQTIEYFRGLLKQKGTLDIKNDELRKILEGKDDPNQAIVLYKFDFSK